MSLLSTATVQNDKVVFRQTFESRRYVLDNSGVLVGCNVGLRGPGIIPTAASSRVTYDRTQSLLVNASQMTVRLKFRTAAAMVGQSNVLAKSPSALNDNQFMVELLPNPVLICYVANAAGDSGQYFYANVVLGVSTEYVAHIVYDGTLAPGSRGIVYLQGASPGTVIFGVLPTSMRAGPAPITVFNRYGGNAIAPPTDFVLRDVKIWAASLTPAEVLDDALNRTYGAP